MSVAVCVAVFEREMHIEGGCVAVSVAVCVAVLEREMHIDGGSSGKVYMKESCI